MTMSVESRIDGAIDDEELARLALAGDLDAPLEPDAAPLDLATFGAVSGLPDWYMPRAAILRCSGWRVPVALAIVASLLVLEALGLCSVFGQVVIG